MKDTFDDQNTLKFYMNVKCTRKPEFKDYTDEQLSKLKWEEYLDHHYVYASDFIWEPVGDQKERLKGQKIGFLYDNILIAKLVEGQEIELEVYCSKNYGHVHTKWSPVSTAYYRLAPHVNIMEPILNEDADRIKQVCPTNVFDIEDMTKKKKDKKLKVSRQENCTMCRACISDPAVGNKIFIGKEKFRYQFTIESIGVIDPLILMEKALEYIMDKCAYYKNYLESFD